MKISLQYKYIYIGILFCLILFHTSNLLYAASAVLSWDPPTTNDDGTPLTDLSGYKVYYGTSSGSYSQSINVGSVTTYQVNDLSVGVTYYFAATAYDTSGNESSYSNEISKTIQASDTTPPVISGIQVTNVTSSSVTVSWITDEPSDTQIKYKTPSGPVLSTTLDPALVTIHSQNITGLSPSSLYYFSVLSRDAAGNLSLSDDSTFTTAARTDTTPPVISGVLASNITSSSVTVSWITNESSDTQIEYGATASYGSTTTLDPLMVTGHSQNISGLSSSTLYHYRVKSRDASGNPAVSGDYTFTTAAPPTSIDFYCDNDNDGYMGISIEGACTGSGCVPSGCQTAPGNDCNDEDYAVNPAAADDDCNGVDDNCDGTPDNNYAITIVSCGTGVCFSMGQIECQSGAEVNTCTPRTPWEIPETTCGDGLDNDCDGQIDEVCSPDIKLSNVLLTEDFSNGIPAAWSAQGAWSTSNTCARTIDYPFIEPYPIVDSSCTMTGVDELITSSFDTTLCDSVELTFSNQFFWYAGNIEVDVSVDGGTTWTNKIRVSGDDGYPVPNWKDIDISSIAGTAYAKIRFRYLNDATDGFWAFDNVWVTCQSSQIQFSSRIHAPSSRTVMVANTGTDDLAIDTINISGKSASDFSIGGNDDCLKQTLLPAETCTFDVVFTPASAGSKNAILTVLSSDPDTPAPVLTLTGTGMDAASPVPIIKVNGSRGVVSVLRSDRSSATIELDPGSDNGKEADWWALMEYRKRWYYYDGSSEKWRRGYSFYKQGQMYNMGPVEILDGLRLPAGSYSFYFGVDTSMNGDMDSDLYYYDKIIVNVE